MIGRQKMLYYVKIFFGKLIISKYMAQVYIYIVNVRVNKCQYSIFFHAFWNVIKVSNQIEI